MPLPPTKSSLTPARRRLLELLQRLNFGRVEGLTVRAGQPLFDPAPCVTREVKFCADNGPRPEAGSPDFTLKGQQAELFDQLDRLGDGVVQLLEVKHGLPFRMLLAERCR